MCKSCYVLTTILLDPRRPPANIVLGERWAPAFSMTIAHVAILSQATKSNARTQSNDHSPTNKRPRATQQAATQQEQQCRCPRSFARSSSGSRTAKSRFVWPRRTSSGRRGRSAGSGSAWVATRDYLGMPNLFSLARGENHCGADAIAAGRQLYPGQTCEW